MNRRTAERSPRKAKGQGPERREEILAAALTLFTEYGAHAVSTRQIAEAVGISQPTLYAYFPTKLDIGKELHSRAFALLGERLAADTKARAAQAIDTVEGLARSLRIYIDFGLENPDMYRMAFMGEPTQAKGVWSHPPPEELAASPAVQSTYGVLRSQLAELHARGLTLDLDIETLTQCAWSAMHGLVSLLIAKPTFPWVEREHLIASHLRVIARGVMGDR